MDKPTVTILTFCNDIDALYGTLLVFKTLRVAFPTSRVVVFDNGSIDQARPEIETAATAAQCEFRSMNRKPYWHHFEWLLFDQDEFQSVVIVDPDCIFWKSVEDWSFPGKVMAGRYIPNLAHLGCRTLERLHPSLLFVPSIEAIRDVRRSNPGWGLIAPTQVGPVFADTFSILYGLTSQNCHRFTSDQLESYDHLFFGSHLRMVKPSFVGDVVKHAHEKALRGDLHDIRGIYKEQDQLFGGSEPDPLAGQIFAR